MKVILPKCFGVRQNPQDKAENDCCTCEYEADCATHEKRVIATKKSECPNCKATIRRFYAYCCMCGVYLAWTQEHAAYIPSGDMTDKERNLVREPRQFKR